MVLFINRDDSPTVGGPPMPPYNKGLIVLLGNGLNKCHLFERVFTNLAQLLRSTQTRSMWLCKALICSCKEVSNSNK